MRMNLLEDEIGAPPKPVEWSWIVQRQQTNNEKSTSIWKFGFICPGGGEVRVTFHQVSLPTLDQQTPPEQQPDSSNPGAQQQPDSGPPPQSDPGDGIILQGQPNPDQTQNNVFYVTFFSNRSPEHFSKFDTSLSHEDSLTMWITITHGIVDFLRKAKPKNLILDDLANGKLKMVLRSVAMDVVATDPDYSLEMTKKHEYRTFYQIKRGGSGSAFDQAVRGKDNEGQTQPPEPNSPVTGPVADMQPDKSTTDTGLASKENSADANEQNPKPEEQKPIKTTPSKKGMAVEIGRSDYSVAVRDNQNNVIDRYRGKNPADILRWIQAKGYGSSRMKVVDKETPSGVIAKTRNAEGMSSEDPQSNMKYEQHCSIDGKNIILSQIIPSKRAGLMNEIVNADVVRCNLGGASFEFATDRDMEFKRHLVELAFQQTGNEGEKKHQD